MRKGLIFVLKTVKETGIITTEPIGVLKFITGAKAIKHPRHHPGGDYLLNRVNR